LSQVFPKFVLGKS